MDEPPTLSADCDTNQRSLFPPTNWDWVAQLNHSSTTVSRSALSKLCSGYWYPIFAYLRGRGHELHEAEDLAQGFFARLLKHDALARAQQGKGSLRSYLLAALHHHIATEHEASTAAKRGAGATHLPIHLAWAEDRLSREDAEPSHQETAEHIFNRRWWALVIEQALHRVKAEYAARGEDRLFESLQPHLEGRPEAGAYKQLAATLCTTEQALRVALFRLRKRTADSVRAVLAETLDDPSAVEAELTAILSR
jgi:DNA-directed RNA polymerase specialized sigma24 family protein